MIFVPQLKRVIESEELISIELNMPEAVDFIARRTHQTLLTIYCFICHHTGLICSCIL